jgi:threonine aldolase
MAVIDLRSDTVTRPPRRCAPRWPPAEVGDDVFGDDPSRQRAAGPHRRAAGQGGRAVHAHGTQSNLCALMAHCGRGDEYIVGQMAHTYRWEGGGAAVLGSIQPQPLAQARPTARCAGRHRGQPSSPTTPTSRAPGCWRWRTPGAARCCRWPTSRPPPRWPGSGPGHPPGRRAAVQRRGGLGRRWRRAAARSPPLRQRVGVLQQGPGRAGGLGPGAALATDRPRPPPPQDAGRRHAPGRRAGRRGDHALDHHVDRLADDHANARRLAEGLQGLPGVAVRRRRPTSSSSTWRPRRRRPPCAGRRAAACCCTGLYRLRLVTHLDVTTADIDRAVPVLRGALLIVEHQETPCPSPTPKP